MDGRHKVPRPRVSVLRAITQALGMKVLSWKFSVNSSAPLTLEYRYFETMDRTMLRAILLSRLRLFSRQNPRVIL